MWWVSSTNKTDLNDITEILLKVALNTVTITLTHSLSEGAWNIIQLLPALKVNNYDVHRKCRQ
jgi:hypothetical protein